MSNLNRRDLLRWSLAAGVATLPTTAIAQPVPRTRALRIAHLTDAHVQPEHGAADGLRACFRHAQTNHKPDLIIAGGDQIMDALAKPAERVQLQFDLWNQIVKEECRTPIQYVIGNHDVWGWSDHKASGTTGTEPRYGKAWAIEAFGMPGRYYSIDKAGWHMVVLDSTQDDGGAYVAMLDDEQFAWLEADLAKVDSATPILIFSHIPILGVCPILFDEKSPTTQGKFPKPRWGVSRALMHLDARRIKELFKKHPNVKLAVSGHIHLRDRVEYLGVTYLCNPAVSAGWWRGPMQEFSNSYTIIDLFADGSFDYQVVDFGWKNQP
jgi:3',5'-cyclic-AMP phosphodiesterase